LYPYPAVRLFPSFIVIASSSIMSIMLIMQGAAGRAKPSFEPVFHDRLRINGALDDADDDDCTLSNEALQRRLFARGSQDEVRRCFRV